MTMMLWISTFVLALACLPLAMLLVNLVFFRRLPEARGPSAPVRGISVLIPARNEERVIGAAIESVLAGRGIEVELIVLDDESTDGTASIVQAAMVRDARVRLIRGAGPPPGWTGKQYACHRLSIAASHDVLVWMDADVRLAEDALVRMARALDERGTALLSGFPRQETIGLMEKLIVPLIHVILLGYLPMLMMRRTRNPAFGAGCGQLFMAHRERYRAVGGHEAIRASMHDGLTLPRSFRRAGFATDIFDASDAASCRMYRTAGEVWWGFGKNAHEAMASPIGLPVWTTLLLGGHVMPWILGIAALFSAGSWTAIALASWAAAILFSLLVKLRFGQPWLSAVGRPIGVTMLVAIQWFAFVRRVLGRPIRWKHRTHPVRLTTRSA